MALLAEGMRKRRFALRAPTHSPANGWCRNCRNGAKKTLWCALEIIGTDAVLDVRAGAADVAIRHARKPPLDLWRMRCFGTRSFPFAARVC
jgi:hypothetical protein